MMTVRYGVTPWIPVNGGNTAIFLNAVSIISYFSSVFPLVTLYIR